MKYPITLEGLEALDAIDRKGSFAAAASSLYRVPSALTYTIQKLEQDLGVQLFQKEGRQSKLTPTGQVLLEQGREILAATNRLAITAKQVHSGWEPVLNIAVDSVLDFNFLYPLLDEFYKLQPDIEINLYEEVLAGAWETILNDTCQLVIGTGVSPPTGKRIESHFLLNSKWVFTVAKHHPLSQQSTALNKSDIEQYRFVVVRDSAQHQPALSKRIFTSKPVLSVPTLNEKIRAQVLGLGVGFLPLHRIENLLASGELVALQINDHEENTRLYMGWKSNNKGKALQWFSERVNEHFKNPFVSF